MPIESATAINNSQWRFYPHLFAERTLPHVWQTYAWLEQMSVVVAQAIAEGGARLIINVPPRHGKTTFFSKVIPLWMIDNWPHRNVITVSHAANYATELGRWVRNEFSSNQSGLLRTWLAEDSKAAGRWNTPQGGGMYCAGMGGGIVGRGFDLGLIDDPIKNARDARSGTVQQAHREWFKYTFMSRAEPNASVIIVMHRWDDEDLCAWVMEEYPEQWTVIRLPAIAEDDGEPDLLEREIGDPLCPERWDADSLKIARREASTAWFPMWQQRTLHDASGRLYHRFSEANLSSTVELRDDLPLQLSVDFNIDPGMHLIIGQHDPKLDAFCAVHEIHGPRMTVEQAGAEVVKLIVEQYKRFKWPDLELFGDATGDAAWAGMGESLYQVLLRSLRPLGRTVRRRTPKRNPPPIDRIMAVNEALCDLENNRRYIIHRRCERLRKDYARMVKGLDGLPLSTTGALSHASSAEGYRIHYLRPVGYSIADMIGHKPRFRSV